MNKQMEGQININEWMENSNSLQTTKEQNALTKNNK